MNVSLGVQLMVHNNYRWVCELRRERNLTGIPLASKDVSDDLSELVEEAAMNSILGGQAELDIQEMEARVVPVCHEIGEPIVDHIQVDLHAANSGRTADARQTFTTGRWQRWSMRKLLMLREEGTVAAEEQIYCLLLALPCEQPPLLQPPPLIPPPVIDSTLEACGVRSIDAGELTPDRPLLVNRRLAEEGMRRCIEAGLVETGAAVAGQYVRLPEPLPGTSTRIVTLFSALLFDQRHSGDAAQFHFSPSALAEAQQLCQLRGLGESVITVFHSHGWGCGDCNQKATCGLAEGKPSLQDYQLLESLLPGKCTLMPISGRKLGADQRQPVLQVYAWRAGEMRAIRWRTYRD